MVTLPDAWKQYNQTTRGFREQYALLPIAIQSATKDACLLFHENRNHTSLRRHLLQDRRTGSHAPGSFSVAITMQYRAIYVEDGHTNIWYWIGTHAAYKQFTGSKR